MKIFSKSNLFIAFFIAFVVFFTIPTSVTAACKTPTDPPSTEPVLLRAVTGPGTVTLTWEKAGDPVTHYLLQYGTSPNNYSYGNPNIGGRDATSYTVGELQNGVRYYFRIRAENGCKPGDFSNKLSAVPGYAQPKKIRNLLSYEKLVLGESTSAAKKNILATEVANEVRCISCNGLPLLVLEVILLAVFYFVTNTTKKMNKFSPFAFIIPLLLFFFVQTQKYCNSLEFTCKYFLLFNVSIFVVMTVLQKQFFISRREKKYVPVSKK